ncbi:hypothetical protein D3C72_924700 [compost metagenome]
MQTQTRLVGNFRPAVHGDHRVMYFRFIHGNRLEYAEKRHRTGDIGEDIQVKAGAADGAHDTAHLLFVVVGTQGLCQRLKALRDRRVEVGVEIHQFRDHHHYAVAVAQVFDVAAAVNEIQHLFRLLIHGAEERAVNHREVVAVGGVFQLDFPVAREAETVGWSGFNRVARPLLHKQVHPFLRRAEELFQRVDLIVKGGEDHARVLFRAQGNQPQLAFFQLVGVAFRMRHAAQAAVQRVAPAVVRADETVGFAAAVFAHGRRAVAAAVKQRVDIAFAVAHHDHRLGT